MRPVRCSGRPSRGEGVLPRGCLPRRGVWPGGCLAPLWTESQTGVKTLRCRKFYVADGKNLVRSNQSQFQYKSLFGGIAISLDLEIVSHLLGKYPCCIELQKSRLPNVLFLFLGTCAVRKVSMSCMWVEIWFFGVEIILGSQFLNFSLITLSIMCKIYFCQCLLQFNVSCWRMKLKNCSQPVLC